MNPFEEIEKHRRQLREGSILAYPTDTLWGLGVEIFNETAVAALRALKKLPEDEGFGVLVRDIAQAKELGVISKPIERAMEIFWPGSVTFMVPLARPELKYLTGGSEFIGLRSSPHPYVKTLLFDHPSPITTITASLGGKKKPVSVEDLKWLPEDVAKVDWPDLASSRGSTAIKFDNGRVSLVREGDFPTAFLFRVIEKHCHLEIAEDKKSWPLLSRFKRGATQ